MSEFKGYFTEKDDVLENLLGIQNPEEMKAVEAEVVSLRLAELYAEQPEGEMNYEYLCQIHRRLFGDLYPMAGKTRSVDIAKGGSAFCYVQFIHEEQQRIFRQMKRRFCADMTPEQFAEQLAWLAAELNALHPFREGNGRAIRAFLVIIAQRHGYLLDYALVSEERRLQADIDAFSGKMGGLQQVYREMIAAQV